MPDFTGKTPMADHRFLDESGDTAFYGTNRCNIIGQKGVSLAFSLGMVKFDGDISDVRRQVVGLQNTVEADEYLKSIPSVIKRANEGGFYFHASDDIPEVREKMFRFIKTLDCSLEMVVGRKIPELFIKKHDRDERNFYADMLSHLLKNKLMMGRKLVLNIAGRPKSTHRANLDAVLVKAVERHAKTRSVESIRAEVVFNVQTPRTESLLNVADYMCWAVQRVFERGETRYYDYIAEKIALVVDLYDREKYEGNRNYYTRKNRLTSTNKISPPSP